MSQKISRRDFLKLSGAALSGLALAPYLPPVELFSDGNLIRVTSNGVKDLGIPVYSQPTDQSRIVSSVFRDQVLNVYEEVNSGTPGYNPIWYRVWGGYVHRARMQKVQNILNPIAQSIREEGQLAEVTVPYTDSLRLVGKDWRSTYRLCYSTIHWVKGIETGPDGKPWYSLHDELTNTTYAVPAIHLRLIPDEEIAPISPEVPFEKKRIEVSLSRQMMTCYEGDKVVLDTAISSGLDIGLPKANGVSTSTPVGKFDIQVKMPSRHMGDGNLAFADSYDLPGVPWTSFIKFHDRPYQGHAFHGTYWHDDFGTPLSHGCINMRTEEAKWFFRWSWPFAGAEQISPLTLDVRRLGTAGVVTP